MSGRPSKGDTVARAACLNGSDRLDNARVLGHVHDAEGRTKPSGAHVSDVMGDCLKPFHAA
jgi:hypothetical protein